MQGEVEDVFLLAERLRKQGKLEPAALAYARAIELQPNNYGALNNLANLKKDMGRFEEAATLFDHALAHCPGEPTLLYNLTLLRLRQTPLAAWGPFLAQGSTQPLYAHEFAVRRAISAWVAGEPLDAFLAQASRLERELGDQQNKNFSVMRAFRLLLEALAQTQPTSAAPQASIIGDSHALCYARAVTEVELVLGCKAWHLAQGGINAYKREVKERLGFLPAGQICFVSIGEIDCRPHEGLLPYCRKAGVSAQAHAALCATGMVRFMHEAAASLGLRLVFLNVPAPHLAALRAGAPEFDDQDFSDLSVVIRSFNAALAAQVAGFHGEIVDLYGLTADQAGFADGAWHLDQFHLKPEALAQAKRGFPTREAPLAAPSNRE